MASKKIGRPHSKAKAKPKKGDVDYVERRGRKTKLTPAVVRKITEAIVEGDTVHDACVGAGISSSTLSNWRAKARGSKDPKLLSFLGELEYAQSMSRRKRLKMISEGKMINGKADWKAAAQYLKMTDPMFSNQALSDRAMDNEMGHRLEAMEAHMSGEAVAEMWAAYAKERGISVD